MGEVLADAALERERLGRRGGGVGRVGIEGHLAVQPLQQDVQELQRVVAGRRAGRGGKAGDRVVGLGQRRLAQEQRRRKPLDRAGHHAVGVAGLDLAFDRDDELAERAVGGEGVADVAEGVLMLIEPAIGRHVDVPVDDVLAVMIARRQPQHLDHAGGRRVVAIGGSVDDADTHEMAIITMASGNVYSLRDHIRYCSVMARAQPVVGGDELADELVQALLEDLLHAAVLKPGADRAGLPLRRALAAIGLRDVVEVLHQIAVAARERARHLVLEDEQVGDQPRLDALPVDPVIGGQRRDRAQDRRPLEIVERAADAFVGRQQQVEFDVEDARGVVGALLVEAEPREPVGVVAQHGAVGAAVEAQRGFLHPAQEAHELLARGRPVAEALELQPGAVDRVPHFHGERGAHGARIGARELEAVADRRRIGGREAQEFGDRLLVGLRIVRGERAGAAGGGDRRFPFVAGADIGERQRGQALRHLEDAREIFRALDVAREPVEVVGGAREHVTCPTPRYPWCRRPGSN